MNQLIALLNKYLRTEAGVKTMVVGDFNLDFDNQESAYTSQVLQQLKDLEFHQQDFNEVTYKRRNAESSSLDHVFTNFSTSRSITT